MLNFFYLLSFFFLLDKTCYFEDPPVNDVYKPGWELVFSDEFDSVPYDPGKWSWHEHWGNVKDSVSWKENCIDSRDGFLRLTTRIDPDHPGGGRYESGEVCSWASFETTYGYFEIRAKVPSGGRDYFPAFWLYGKNSWPPEIDVFEFLKKDSRRMSMTYHWLDTRHNHRMKGRTLKGIDMSESFHTYALSWSPGRLTWYLDNIAVYTINKSIPSNKMYILINMSASETYHTILPEATMLVDYCRVYKKAE